MVVPTLERAGVRSPEPVPAYLRLDNINPVHARFSMIINGAICGEPSAICVRVEELFVLSGSWHGGWRVLDERTGRVAQAIAPDWALAVGLHWVTE